MEMFFDSLCTTTAEAEEKSKIEKLIEFFTASDLEEKVKDKMKAANNAATTTEQTAKVETNGK